MCSIPLSPSHPSSPQANKFWAYIQQALACPQTQLCSRLVTDPAEVETGYMPKPTTQPTHVSSTSSSALSRQPKQIPEAFTPLNERWYIWAFCLCQVPFSLWLSGGRRRLRSPGQGPCLDTGGGEAPGSASACAPSSWSPRGAQDECPGLCSEPSIWDSHWRLFTRRFAWQINSPQQPSPCQGLSGTVSPSQRGPSWAGALPAPPFPHRPRGPDSHGLSKALPRAVRVLPAWSWTGYFRSREQSGVPLESVCLRGLLPLSLPK